MTDMQTLLAGMVRPLEFDAGPYGHYYADSKVGSYTVQFFAGDYFVCLDDVRVSGFYKVSADAQSAAQADYTARILAALNPGPVLALVAAAYADAAKAIVGLGGYATNGFKAASVPDTFDEGTCAAHDAVEILAQSDPLATAALARMLADARAEAYERAAYECAELAEHSAEENDWPDGAKQARSIAAAIRAMKGGRP